MDRNGCLSKSESIQHSGFRGTGVSSISAVGLGILHSLSCRHIIKHNLESQLFEIILAQLRLIPKGRGLVSSNCAREKQRESKKIMYRERANRA